MKFVRAMVAACVVSPIWLYLLYYILTKVEASELAWFLFYVYVPSTLFVTVLHFYMADESGKRG